MSDQMSGGKSLTSAQTAPCNEAEERVMHESFLIQAKELLKDPTRFDKPADTLKIGIESEVAILKTDGTPADETLRNLIITDCPMQVGATVELGASQIEFHTIPVNILTCNGWHELKTIYEKNFSLLAAATRAHNSSILRCGANPFVPVRGTPRTNLLKYKLVPDFYNEFRDPSVNTRIGRENSFLDIGDAAIVSAFQGFQVNVEARSLTHAVSMLNRMLALGPYFTAPSGNARFLESTDTGLNDTRLIAWGKSHHRSSHTLDTHLADLRLIAWEKTFTLKNTTMELGLRVGLPPSYFPNAESYILRSGRFPFILNKPEAALPIAIGMTWLDAKLKFIGDSAVVEWRLPSTQPHIEDELTLALLMIGALTDAEANKRPLLPISYVAENRRVAMELGSTKEIWFVDNKHELNKLPYHKGITWEIARAKHGLSLLGLSRHLNKSLFRSWVTYGSHSERLAKRIGTSPNYLYSKETLTQALRTLSMIIS